MAAKPGLNIKAGPHRPLHWGDVGVGGSGLAVGVVNRPLGEAPWELWTWGLEVWTVVAPGFYPCQGKVESAESSHHS